MIFFLCNLKYPFFLDKSVGRWILPSLPSSLLLFLLSSINPVLLSSITLYIIYSHIIMRRLLSFILIVLDLDLDNNYTNTLLSFFFLFSLMLLLYCYIVYLILFITSSIHFLPSFLPSFITFISLSLCFSCDFNRYNIV